MLEYLKPISKEKWDCITFFSGNKKNSVNVHGNLYANGGEPIGENNFHVILVTDHKTDKSKFANLDVFDAILLDPLEYISHLIPAGLFGIIARKTTNSQKFIDSVLDNIRKTL